MITVRPYGGLCNRMRTIASSVTLSLESDNPLRVIWIANSELNATYNQLFTDCEFFKVVNNPFLSTVRYPHYSYSLHKFFEKNTSIASLFNINRLGQIFFDKFYYGPYCTQPCAIDIIEKDKVYITSSETFLSQYMVNELFIPIPMLQQKINFYSDQFNSSTIGVHIRRTDHELSISKSPVQAFIDTIKKEIDNNSAVSFYLATDCLNTEKTLISLFGKRILFQNKVRGRNSVDGIQCAVIDLFCLANTRKIIGSHSSSFSTMAADLGKLSLEISMV